MCFYSIYITLSSPDDLCSNVLGQCKYLLLLKPPANELYGYMSAIEDLRIICESTKSVNTIHLTWEGPPTILPHLLIQLILWLVLGIEGIDLLVSQSHGQDARGIVKAVDHRAIV